MIVSQLPNKKIKDRREKLTENVKLYQAAESDIEEITGLYEQAKGSKFCTWDEHYPNTEIARGDLERDALFCMKTETGEIVGAISIDDDKEVENLKCWSKTLKPSVEIARLVVKTEWQNKKIAPKMLKELLKIIADRGIKGAHYLVDKNHKKALAAYKSLNFIKVGESTLYDGNSMKGKNLSIMAMIAAVFCSCGQQPAQERGPRPGEIGGSCVVKQN